jgi:hypothetical protein
VASLDKEVVLILGKVPKLGPKMSVVLVKGYQKCYSKKVFTSFSIYPGEALTLSFNLLEKIPKLGLKISVVLVKGYQVLSQKSAALERRYLFHVINF